MDESVLRGGILENRTKCVVSWFVGWFEVIEAWLVDGLEVEVDVVVVCVFEVIEFWLVGGLEVEVGVVVVCVFEVTGFVA